MRDYAKVMPKFWHGETCQEIRLRGSEGPLVALYLMTSPMSNMLGLFSQPLLYMAEETGLGLEGARKGLQDCIDAGFCKYHEAGKIVWVIEMAAYQIAPKLKASDNRCAGIQKDYDALPNNPFLGEFFDRYQAAFHLTGRRGPEGASKPLGSQEQEQEQEQEQNPSLPTAAQSADLLGDHPSPADLGIKRAERLAAVSADAVAAYNRILGKPNGLLRAVRPGVGQDTRRDQVKRCVKTAAEICQSLYGDSRITPAFWEAYFESASDDPFHSGRGPYGGEHANWRPDFEFLTRRATMLKLFERAVDDDAEAA